MSKLFLVALILSTSPAISCVTKVQANGIAALMFTLQLTSTARACDLAEEGVAKPVINRYSNAVEALMKQHSVKIKSLIDPWRIGFSSGGNDWSAFVTNLQKQMNQETLKTISVSDCRDSYKYNTTVLLDWNETLAAINFLGIAANKGIEICG